MSDLVLTRNRILAGVWEGTVTCANPDDPEPQIVVTHQDVPVTGLIIAPDKDQPGRYLLAIPIPVELLTDGVQTFLIFDGATGQRLDSFAIVTGEPLEDDIRAEVDLLRSELDMLKKAFRRHCLETS